MATKPDAVQIEFWIATATDDQGDLHWSDIIWGDGYDAPDALKEAMRRAYNDALGGFGAATFAVHGPYLTNDAAACPA